MATVAVVEKGDERPVFGEGAELEGETFEVGGKKVLA